MALCKNDGGQDRRVAVTVLFTLGALLEHATRMLRLPSNAVALWSTAGMPIISISQLSQINKVKLVASCGEPFVDRAEAAEHSSSVLPPPQELTVEPTADQPVDAMAEQVAQLPNSTLDTLVEELRCQLVGAVSTNATRS